MRVVVLLQASSSCLNMNRIKLGSPTLIVDCAALNFFQCALLSQCVMNITTQPHPKFKCNGVHFEQKLHIKKKQNQAAN